MGTHTHTHSHTHHSHYICDRGIHTLHQHAISQHGHQNTHRHNKHSQTPMAFFLKHAQWALHIQTYTNSTGSRTQAEASTLGTSLAKSNRWSPEHTLMQEIHTKTHGLFIKGIHIGPHKDTHTHTRNLIPVIPTTHTYTAKTHKHPWSFSYMHTQWASRTHTHTHTAHTLSLRQRHLHFTSPYNLTNVVPTTHKHNKHTQTPLVFSYRMHNGLTHTHSYTQHTLYVCSRGIHTWHSHGKLTNVVPTTHKLQTHQIPNFL